MRDWNENTFRIGNRAEVGSADRVVRSAEFSAERQTLLGLEGVWRRRSLQLQGEYMATRVEEADGPDWDYSGFYVTASYLLTGERRVFRKGEFRTLRPLAESAIVFTAGIGEHADRVRARVISYFDFMGIKIDTAKNRKHAPIISASGSKIKVLVIPTNEELMMAKEALQLIR